MNSSVIPGQDHWQLPLGPCVNTTRWALRGQGGMSLRLWGERRWFSFCALIHLFELYWNLCLPVMEQKYWSQISSGSVFTERPLCASRPSERFTDKSAQQNVKIKWNVTKIISKSEVLPRWSQVNVKFISVFYSNQMFVVQLFQILCRRKGHVMLVRGCSGSRQIIGSHASCQTCTCWMYLMDAPRLFFLSPRKMQTASESSNSSGLRISSLFLQNQRILNWRKNKIKTLGLLFRFCADFTHQSPFFPFFARLENGLKSNLA